MRPNSSMVRVTERDDRVLVLDIGRHGNGTAAVAGVDLAGYGIELLCRASSQDDPGRVPGCE